MTDIRKTPLNFFQGDGALDAGVRLLPLIIAMVLTCMVSGVLLPKTPRFSPWYIVGSALVLIGTALMCTSLSSMTDQGY